MKKRTQTVGWLGLTLALLGLTSCIKPLPDGTETFRNQSYGSHQRNKIDVFLPEVRDTSTRTVVLVHGGAWVGGDKAGQELKDIRNRLLEEGFAVASMNYRYACGDFTKQMEDIDNALLHLQSNASEWIFNPNKFALIGLSAGGHLSLLYSHAFNQNQLVKTVVSIVGPTDLTDPLFHTYASNYNLYWTIETLMGTEFELDSALYAAASPINHPSNIPTLFIYGAQDDLVPAEQGIAFFDTLNQLQFQADTVVPPLGTHSVNGPSNQYKEMIESEITHWLETF